MESTNSSRSQIHHDDDGNDNRSGHHDGGKHNEADLEDRMGCTRTTQRSRPSEQQQQKQQHRHPHCQEQQQQLELLGVSVHWLCHGLVDEILDHYYDDGNDDLIGDNGSNNNNLLHRLRNCCIHDLETLTDDDDGNTTTANSSSSLSPFDDKKTKKSMKMGIARTRGQHITCPIDGRLGCSYVHSLLLDPPPPPSEQPHPLSSASETPTTMATIDVRPDEEVGSSSRDCHDHRGDDDDGDDDAAVAVSVVLGPATHMLSYTWSYKFLNIIDALSEFCKAKRLDPKKTYVWWDWLCINQHRVVEAKRLGQTGLLKFEEEFPKQMRQIGHMLAMMEPWNNPQYLSRIWCIFEFYVANNIQEEVGERGEATKVVGSRGADLGGCETSIIMPKQERVKLRNELFGGGDGDGDGVGGKGVAGGGSSRGGGGDLDALYEVFSKTKIQNAQSTFASDRELILGMIRNTVGYNALNNKVNQLLRSWIRGVIDEVIEKMQNLNYLTLPKPNNNHSSSNKKQKKHVGGVFTATFDDDVYDCLSNIDNDVIMMQIGNFLLRNGEFEEALKWHRRCLSTRLAKDDENNEFSCCDSKRRIADCYSCIGHVLRHQGNFDAALFNYKKALSMRTRILGTESHPDIAKTHNRIGDVLYSKGDFTGALLHNRDALVLYADWSTVKLEESRHRCRHEQHNQRQLRMAQCYVNIGIVLEARYEYDEAMIEFRKALDIRRSMLATIEHPAIAYAFNCLASVLMKQGKYDEALEMCNKAVPIYESVFGINHHDTAYTYCLRSRILSKQGANFDQALLEAQRALRFFEANIGTNHHRTAFAYQCVGFVLSKQGDNDSALVYLNKSLSIRKRVFGYNHPRTADTYYDIGNLLFAASKSEEALEHYQHALTINKPVLGIGHPHTIMSLSCCLKAELKITKYESCT